MKYFFFFASLLLVLGACKTTKVDVPAAADGGTTYKKLLSKFTDLSPEYKSLSSDIRLDADVDNGSYRATGLIRHVRDEGIFISVKKLGFEIGQVLITKDSFFVLNRWEKEYISEPISAIEAEYKIRGEYAMVEELLTGIPRVPTYAKNDKSTIESGHHRLELESMYENIGLTLWLNNENQPVEQAFYQDDKSRGVRMKYQDETVNKLVIERELHTQNIENEIHVKLEYRNPEFDNTSLPAFRIPDHYSRRRI